MNDPAAGDGPRRRERPAVDAVDATLPRAFYVSRASFDESIEKIFARSWQLVGHAEPSSAGPRAEPVSFLGGALDEPLLLTWDASDRLSVLSNVCTHRGAILCDRPGPARALRCPYHGRRFELDGSFRSAPGFAAGTGAERRTEDLRRFPHATWGPLLFAALDPVRSFDAQAGAVRDALEWYPWERLAPAPELEREFRVRANWALYCENYLEGLHIPFVHGGLAGEIELSTYRELLFPHASLQIADAKREDERFGAMAPDEDRSAAALYAFLFPNTMVNVYPWGLSLNVVVPIAPDETIVRYSGFMLDPSRIGRGAGGDLDRVEAEDDAVVESCQRGVSSRSCVPGRLSRSHERAVAHFRESVVRALEHD